MTITSALERLSASFCSLSINLRLLGTQISVAPPVLVHTPRQYFLVRSNFQTREIHDESLGLGNQPETKVQTLFHKNPVSTRVYRR